jgi:hypothetical protein
LLPVAGSGAIEARDNECRHRGEPHSVNNVYQVSRDIILADFPLVSKRRVRAELTGGIRCRIPAGFA